ncbi:PREDICTED: sialin-like isoform X2 [Ceratosolen solmsi marchali]|nr:PREDICTED: sialin-like isoform X2 [Ceratosolen solmsi marchali]
MCFLALFNAYAMRACLSIAITEMVVPITVPEAVQDETCPSMDVKLPINQTKHFEGTYEWDEYTQGLILSSFYWGYIITHLPGGMIADKYGGKYTLGIGILLTAIFTLLTPLAVYWGESNALIALRILMGLGEGTTYPAINVLLAQWTPPEERSRTGSFVYAGALIGTIYATMVSGLILYYSNTGWPTVFYVIGTTSIIWFVIWLLACYNNPRDHPFISIDEVNYLKERMSKHTHDEPSSVPWKLILMSKPLWAVIIALIGFNWSILTIVTDLPKYMSGVLKFSVQNNGYLTSFVYLCMWIGGTASSCLADYLITKDYASITQVRKLGSILALPASASFIVAASYAGCDRVLVIGMFTIAMLLMGTAFPSVMVNALDLSPNYAGTLMALTNGLSALTGIASPYIIGIITPNQTLSEWRLVFWILFGMSVISNLIFLKYGSGKVEDWNDPKFIRVRSRKRESFEEINM